MSSEKETIHSTLPAPALWHLTKIATHDLLRNSGTEAPPPAYGDALESNAESERINLQELQDALDACKAENERLRGRVEHLETQIQEHVELHNNTLEEAAKERIESDEEKKQVEDGLSELRCDHVLLQKRKQEHKGARKRAEALNEIYEDGFKARLAQIHSLKRDIGPHVRWKTKAVKILTENGLEVPEETPEEMLRKPESLLTMSQI